MLTQVWGNPAAPNPGAMWYDSSANKFKYYENGTTRTLGLDMQNLDDAFGTPSVGGLAVRGPGGWTTVTPGTAGMMLQSNGPGNMPTWASAGGGGVTNVDVAMPSMFAKTGGPITSTGTINFSLQNQSQNLVFAGPTSGSATPSFRSLNISDIRSVNTGSFLAGTTCGVDQAVVYSSVSDTISCQVLSFNNITGPGAINVAAGGANQNVALTPSGTGSTILNGKVGVGNSSPNYSLDMTGRTDAFVMPAGTTAQRPAGVNGALRYNTDQFTVEFYNGFQSTWQSVNNYYNGRYGFGTSSPSSIVEITSGGLNQSPSTSKGSTLAVGMSGTYNDPSSSGSAPGHAFVTLAGGPMTSTNSVTTTNAFGVLVNSAPRSGSGNQTIQNSIALGVGVSNLSGPTTVTNGYGLYVNAPTGATNNYAAVFTGGNVGVGTTMPTAQFNSVAPSSLQAGVFENGGAGPTVRMVNHYATTEAIALTLEADAASTVTMTTQNNAIRITPNGGNGRSLLLGAGVNNMYSMPVVLDGPVVEAPETTQSNAMYAAGGACTSVPTAACLRNLNNRASIILSVSGTAGIYCMQNLNVQNGQRITVVQTNNTYNTTFNDSASCPANYAPFKFGGTSVVLTGIGSATFMYDSVTAAWYAISVVP